MAIRKFYMIVVMLAVMTAAAGVARDPQHTYPVSGFEPGIRSGMKVEFEGMAPCWFLVDAGLRIRVEGDTLRFTSTIWPEADPQEGTSPKYMEYSLADVKRVTYGMHMFTGIGNVTDDTPVVMMSGNTLRLVKEGTHICRVVSLAGTVCDEIRFRDVLTLDMTRYGRGIHIVDINGMHPVKVKVD